ncbi:acetyltransferase [Haematobacter massiliensis]|uniref:Acetyltransferase n=1 Tax=Haematobacter massiliensis TaxID=195105 RepID=A0A086XY87_9RHOB|nr:polysaccharide biosynthesis tyrosine autokinase [Haematobacter massiliensis]KFI26987.1 acetyltransferase [Haematobacter massiliensis]OWJ71012.1 acetyltransferase [Haematobacter massiliensis]OWJ88383.1 acetyltransferase [Haematobacter massiliensis]
MSPKPPREAEAKEVDLAALAEELWAAKGKVAGFTAAGLLAGVLYIFLTAPTYEADALIQLEPKTGNLAVPSGLSDLMGGGQTQATTERELIMSRLVLNQAVADVHLEWTARPRQFPVIGYALRSRALPFKGMSFLRPYAQGGERIRLDLLAVPPHWTGETFTLTKGDGDTFRVTTPDGRLFEGRVGEVLQDTDIGFALRVGELEGQPGRQFEIAHRETQDVIEGLRRSLSVAEKTRDSGILELSFTSRDRVEAQRTLAAIAQAYVRQNVERSAAQAENSLGFIQQQIPKARQDMLDAQDRLNTYRESQRSVDIQFETQNLLTQIGTLETELRELRSQEDEVADLYTKNHPRYRQLLAQRERLEDQLNKLRGEIGTLPDTQREILNYTHDVEMAQEIYTELLTRAQEVDVMRASTVGNVRIVDPAETQIRPVAPRKARVLALALLLGGMLGAGYVLLRNWLRKGIQSASDLEDMGLTVFATINKSPDAERPEGGRGGRVPLLAATKPTDLAVEGLRSLRTGLHFGMLDAPSRTLAITSTAPGAGKSFLSANFAVVSAQAGQSVCLIDADMRRGRLRRMFDVPRDAPGFADILTGQARLEDVLVPTGVQGLVFLPAGKFPPNPAELLLRPTLPALIRELDQRFDLSIFDCPPVLAVTDPVIIAKAAGASLLVARFDETPEGEIRAAQAAMEAAGTGFKGAVFNAYDHRKAKSAQSYSYRYEYKAKEE